MGTDSVAANRLAGFGSADMQNVPSGRRPPEFMIECDDAMDFRSADVERGRHHWFGIQWNTAENVLQSVEHRQRGAFHGGMAGDDLPSAIVIPWLKT